MKAAMSLVSSQVMCQKSPMTATPGLFTSRQMAAPSATWRRKWHSLRFSGSSSTRVPAFCAWSPNSPSSLISSSRDSWWPSLVWLWNAGTMIMPVDFSAPAAVRISFMESSAFWRSDSCSEIRTPSKPAQTALILILRPSKAFCSSSTRLARPRPPGSKPSKPFASRKSSFSANDLPGATPS